MERTEQRMEREKNNPQIRRLFDDCRRAWAVNEENLMEILRKNQDTEYGKAYGFGAGIPGCSAPYGI